MANKNKEKSRELNNIKDELFSVKKEEYGNEYNKHLLEEYKLYVNLMDKTSERRSSANTFFLTLNSAIIGLMGIISKLSGGPFIINILEVSYWRKIFC